MYVITGATGGLGKAFAAACAQRGYALFLTDIDQLSLQKLKDGLQKLYKIPIIISPCDLTSEAERDLLYEQIQKYQNELDGLINVAGGDPEGFFSQRDMKSIRESMYLNIVSTTELISTMIRFHTDADTKFTIINVSSLAAFQPMPYKALYAAAKRYILHLTYALQRECKGHNIRFTALCPAGMPTTKECIDAIRVQGFIGRITTKNVGYVAEKCLKRADKRSGVCIPGLINQAIKTLSNLISDSKKARFVEKRWGKAFH